jgi:ubiquinone biosynthesis protein COQ4
MCFLSVVGGTIRLNPSKRDVLLRDYLPWALKAGRASSDLMCIYYEDHFHEDLADVRKKWGILPAPAIHSGTRSK